MAVKNCCSQSKEQQLYMLELLVDRLNLTNEKIHEIGSTPLCVKLEFLDFPTFVINEEEFWSTSKRKFKESTLSSERKNKDGSLDFSAGKSFLFPKKPNELVEAMRSKPMKIGVYKFVPKVICEPEIREIPICKTEVPLTGCLCDQVAMAANDSMHLPKPYTVRNTWNLIDEEEKPSGTILLFLRLTCLGKSVVTQFAVQEKSFLFKSDYSANEFECSRVPPDEEELKKRAEEAQDKICFPEGYVQPELDPSPKPQSVIGLAPICQELAKRDGGPLENVPSIKLSTNRVPVEEKKISKACSSDRYSRQSQWPFEFPCGNNVCSGGLCTGPKMIETTRRQPTNSIHTRNSRENEGYQKNYCYKPRMRGGGRWDEYYKKGKYSTYFEGKLNKVPRQSIETLISGACTSNKNASKPGCGCFGKLGTGMKTAMNTCSNNPCHGVDCLIRAFKETQNFVDSFGKVPGLVGLGLMDPSESPFFGRDRDEALTSCSEKNKSTILGKETSSVHPFALKSHPMMRGVTETKAIDTILPAPGAGHVSLGYRDPNAFHADTISLASAKSRKKIDEKNEKHKDNNEQANNRETVIARETGPCGTTRCKSRKKKPQDEIRNEEASAIDLQAATPKLGARSKSINSRRARLRGKSKSYADLVNPNAYRFSGQRNSSIRVSRRIMKLVNDLRDPRFSHGHKNCQDVRLRVPGNMGWLWNTGEMPGNVKPKIGWKPGAVSKFVWDRLQQAKAASTTDSNTTNESRPTTPGKVKRGIKSLKSTRSLHSTSRSPWSRHKFHEDDRDVELPPTLHVHRKNGSYYVTMYPVKGENLTDPEIQEKVKPLQFMVTKNKDDSRASSSSSAPDMEIEFSPPAAINRYRKNEPRKDQNTQVIQQEILDTFKTSVSEKQDKKIKKSKVKK